MKKSKIIYGLITLALFMGILNVEAKSYTAYKAGDKITVNVSESKQLNFYVISDSDGENVTAIYEGFLGEKTEFKAVTNSLEGSLAETKLKEYTADWNNPSEIRLIKVQEIVPGIEMTKDSLTSYMDIKNPIYNYFENDKVSYWTQDVLEEVLEEEKKYYPIIVSSLNVFAAFTMGGEIPDEESATFDEFDAYIRPVITISKDHVVGGTHTSETETLWEDFVEAYKNTGYLEEYFKEVKVTHTSDSLKVITIYEDESFETNFTYKDGIITLIPTEIDEESFVELFKIENCIYAIADLKKYDIEALIEYINSKETFTLENDGFELTEKDVTLDESTSFNRIASFKLDIQNGIKSYKPSNKVVKEEVKNEVIENPKIGDTTRNVIITLSASALVGIVVYKRLKKYSKFPQA